MVKRLHMLAPQSQVRWYFKWTYWSRFVLPQWPSPMNATRIFKFSALSISLGTKAEIESRMRLEGDILLELPNVSLPRRPLEAWPKSRIMVEALLLRPSWASSRAGVPTTEKRFRMDPNRLLWRFWGGWLSARVVLCVVSINFQFAIACFLSVAVLGRYRDTHLGAIVLLDLVHGEMFLETL